MLASIGLTPYTAYHAPSGEEREPKPVTATPVENTAGSFKPVSELDKPNASKSSDDLSEVEAKLAKVKAQEQLRLERIEQQQIQDLSARDREVRLHEQAHAAVGGQYAGAPRYQYQRGPDGVNYAVGGEVSIDTSAVSGDPRATIEKARIVKQAALAPAEPSPQDRRVAAEASQMQAQAMAELVAMEREQRIEEQHAQEENRIQSEEKNSAGPLSQTENKPVEEKPPVISEEQATFNRLSAALGERLVGSRIEFQAPRPGQVISQFA